MEVTYILIVEVAKTKYMSIKCKSWKRVKSEVLSGSGMLVFHKPGSTGALLIR